MNVLFAMLLVTTSSSGAAASSTPAPSPAATVTGAPSPNETPEAQPTWTPAEAPMPPARVIKDSPKWASFEVGGGVLQPTGSDVKAVYTDKQQAHFHVRGGVLLASILDVGIGADFAQISGHRVGLSGATSAELTRLTLAPIDATGIVRLDFFHHQPLVPYGGAGIAYCLWQERDIVADHNVSGDKWGWTALGGLMINLGALAPNEQHDMDAWYGINDTFLTVEYQMHEYDRLGAGVEGLDLSHWDARASFLFEF